MAVRKGSVRAQTVIKDNVTKEEKTSDVTEPVELAGHVESIDVGVTSGKPVAVVRTGASVKLSINYQTVGVDVGVEIPWSVSPGPGMKADLEAAFKFAESVVDKKIEDRVEEARALLKQLGGR